MNFAIFYAGPGRTRSRRNEPIAIEKTKDTRMNKNQAWLPLVFAVILITGMAIGYLLRERIPTAQGFFQPAQRSAVQEAMDLIRLNYVDGIAIDSIADDAIEAMLEHLDPHSIFIPRKYLQRVNEDLQGNFEGIGVEFQIIRDTVNFVSILPGGPSEKAGLLTGDKLIRVGDSLVAGNGISSERIKSLLKGPGKTSVMLTVVRGGNSRQIAVERGLIPLYSVDAAYMIDDTTGYIHLNKFSGTSYEECMAAFEKLNEAGMKKLIFDLRGNGGGILAEAVDIADEFLSGEKLVVYTQGNRQPKVEYNCKRPGQFEDGRLVVLVDEGSASASEVIAGAVQDWDRGTIVGRRTFGKGLVQEQFNLSNGSALRLTVARYYTPAGRSIQKSYSQGRKAYNEEVMERFHNGAVVHPDTVAPDEGKAFKTAEGRTVYGGGGISPDIFVPYDTTGFTTNMAPLFANQRFSQFIYEYYMANKDLFDQYQDAADFSRRYVPGEPVWESLLSFLQSNGITLTNLPAEDRQEINKRLKTWMARQIWGMPGFYEVNNVYDLTVQRALQLN